MMDLLKMKTLNLEMKSIGFENPKRRWNNSGDDNFHIFQYSIYNESSNYTCLQRKIGKDRAEAPWKLIINE